jgi:hypothetical protein
VRRHRRLLVLLLLAGVPRSALYVSDLKAVPLTQTGLPRIYNSGTYLTVRLSKLAVDCWRFPLADGPIKTLLAGIARKSSSSSEGHLV